MYQNAILSEEQQRNIRIELLKMKSKSLEEIFSDEYRKKNPIAFEEFFVKNYKLVLTDSSAPFTQVLYYNESKNDFKVSSLGQYEMELDIPKATFTSIDQIKSKIYQSNSKYYDSAYKNILNTSEALSDELGNKPKMKV